MNTDILRGIIGPVTPATVGGSDYLVGERRRLTEKHRAFKKVRAGTLAGHCEGRVA